MSCFVFFKDTLGIVIKDVFFIGRFGGEEQQEENRVHLGNAIMAFYSALIDLLGRCAPEMHVSRTTFHTINFFKSSRQLGSVCG